MADARTTGGSLFRIYRDTLHAIRSAIAARPARWRAIVEAPAFRQRFRLGGVGPSTP